jgi:hypothetical protein
MRRRPSTPSDGSPSQRTTAPGRPADLHGQRKPDYPGGGAVVVGYPGVGPLVAVSAAALGGFSFDRPCMTTRSCSRSGRRYHRCATHRVAQTRKTEARPSMGLPSWVLRRSQRKSRCWASHASSRSDHPEHSIQTPIESRALSHSLLSARPRHDFARGRRDAGLPRSTPVPRWKHQGSSPRHSRNADRVGEA